MDERRHSDLLGYRVYRTQRMLAQCLEDALARYGITPGQWNALNQLDKRGPLSQRALADALQRKPATITRSIDKMEEMGLVERVPDATDRRANVIVLRPAARDLLERIQPDAVDLADRMREGISDEELALLFRLLDTVYDNADKAARPL
ncbi:MAG: MarR family transcriptional regulator [Slackia piriformis]|uniref:MarR family transcriptional regulator n=1 Tax=Slackia piriformis TaxID=626934 RepID=A0A943UYX5_9ACTN|nr:MarR family transcriptional regulator [Slackia piriformis]